MAVAVPAHDFPARNLDTPDGSIELYGSKAARIDAHDANVASGPLDQFVSSLL